MAKLKSLPQSKLPSTAKAGDVFYTTDSKQVFFAIADGSLLNLGDLLSGAVPHVRVVGPTGEQGIQGTSGDRGARGEDAVVHIRLNDEVRQAIASAVADAIARIPTPRGERGPQGEPGSLTVVGDAELREAIKKLKSEKARVLAVVATKVSAMGDHGVYRLAKKHLEDIQKELEK